MRQDLKDIRNTKNGGNTEFYRLSGERSENMIKELIHDPIFLAGKVRCRSGRRSKEAAQKLVALGYTNIVEFGGILDCTSDVVS